MHKFFKVALNYAWMDGDLHKPTLFYWNFNNDYLQPYQQDLHVWGSTQMGQYWGRRGEPVIIFFLIIIQIQIQILTLLRCRSLATSPLSAIPSLVLVSLRDRKNLLLSGKGRCQKKTGKCGNFSHVGDPPSPRLGMSCFWEKKNYGLFCILGP